MYRQTTFHRCYATSKAQIAGGKLNVVQSISEMPFIAGHVALDFVNTAEERGHPDAYDALRTPADLALWGKRRGLITRPAAAGADEQAELGRAVEARELLYDLFFAHVHGHAMRKAQLARLAELVTEAYGAGHLRPADDGSVGWRWSRSELATVRHVAVASALDLLRSSPAGRMRQCPGDHCGWFFLDTTKRGNRRWCSMSACGQEAKDERRRAQRRAISGRGSLKT
jgi:predicted RNA-binding Zn ribbon-like protein